MSKKLYSTQRWKRYLKARQLAADFAAKRHKKRRSGRQSKAPVRPVHIRAFQMVPAPPMLSMVKYPDEAIAFLGNLNFYAQRYNLTLDLSRVAYLTTDAIAALVATLIPFRRIPVLVRGSLPKDAAAQSMLVGSGFFDHFRSVQALPTRVSGQIQQERSRRVQPDVARDLIHWGIKSILGVEQKCAPAYRVLIECMLNTHNHAAREGAKRETWWATVYADHARKRVCFTFVDAGVGIFRSIRLKKLQSLYRRLGFRTDAAILRDMLLGKVESSTGISYRGKGLPSIYKLAQLGSIKSVVIIANDVYANVSEGLYKTLGIAFRGTLVYWEIELQ